MPKKVDLAQQILDKALELAETGSWETLHLYEVAAALNITLDQIREHYRQKDDLVETWFDRADTAMLNDAASHEFAQLSSRERIHRAIMTWLQALAQHRRITGEMLRYKLEFGHVHLQILGIMRVSRTVQWVREATRQEATDLRRIVEEVVLTSIYLATFAYWLRDDSPDSENTSRFLHGLLDRPPLAFADLVAW
ncbi:MAG: TetR/AcrR family transcriptional regulator [Gammaproteobacteria bacterium]